jgi:preprotein translocase subunit SecG
MAALISVFIIIVCVLIIGIVVIQNPKGGGISSGFGSVNQIAGVKQMTEGVEKITWILAVVLFVLCLASAYMVGSGKGSSTTDVNYNDANPETTIQTEGIESTGTGVSMPK